MLMFCSYVHVAQCFIPLLVDLDPTKVANLQRFTDILESLFDQVISEGNIHVQCMYVSAVFCNYMYNIIVCSGTVIARLVLELG